MDGDFSPFEQGNQYQNPQHPYSLDLDVFGRDSLFNRICRTITTAGSDVLAENLSKENPLSKEELAKRTALQKELAELGEDWRMEFFVLGEKNKNEVLDGPARTASYSKLNNLHVDMAAEPTRRVISYQKIDSAAVLMRCEKSRSWLCLRGMVRRLRSFSVGRSSSVYVPQCCFLSLAWFP